MSGAIRSCRGSPSRVAIEGGINGHVDLGFPAEDGKVFQDGLARCSGVLNDRLRFLAVAYGWKTGCQLCLGDSGPDRYPRMRSQICPFFTSELRLPGMHL